MSGIFRKTVLAALPAAALAFSSVPADAGQILYGVTGAGMSTSDLYTINTTTGAATIVGATGFGHVVSMDFNPLTGVLYGIANGPSVNDNSLITIDPATGAGTLVTTVSGDNWADMAFSSSGTLYAWNGGLAPNDLYTIDLTTGTPTLVGSSLLNTTQAGLGIDSTGTIYLKDDSVAIYRIDAGTGAATFVSAVGCCDFDNALAFDANDVLYTLDRTSTDAGLYTIDPTTGVATFIGNTGAKNLAALAFRTTTAVPEPGALSILLLGLAGLGTVRKRRGL